jgi:ribosomal protein S12 methylthiotransferase accessory factor
MAMEITFPGGKRVEARFEGQTIVTDQDDSAPAPFDLFLASIGTCTGYYVAKFCQSRSIPLDNLRVLQRTVVNPETKMTERIEVEIELPDDFPERYRDAVVRSARLCAVKKHLEQPPKIDVVTSVAAAG